MCLLGDDDNDKLFVNTRVLAMGAHDFSKSLRVGPPIAWKPGPGAESEGRSSANLPAVARNQVWDNDRRLVFLKEFHGYCGPF